MSDYCVYKVTSDKSSQTYYGYCVGDNCKHEFVRGAKRGATPGQRRGATEIFELVDENEDMLDVSIVDVCIDELEAWCSRNDQRASDIFSITGPSHWPPGIADRAKSKHPERIDKWASNMKIHACKSARKAAQLGAFSFDTFKDLGKKHGRDQVMKDMDALNAAQFSEKYDVPVQLKTTNG